MEPDRWRQVEKLYHAALKLSPSERSAFLDEQCRDDAELRREVSSLLSYETSAQTFIESPAFEVAAKIMAQGSDTQPSGQQSTHTAPPRFRLLEKLGSGGLGGKMLRQRFGRVERLEATGLDVGKTDACRLPERRQLGPLFGILTLEEA